MPKRKPAYTLYKPTGQARVRIDGKDHDLGRFRSPESRNRYDELIVECGLSSRGKPSGRDLRRNSLSIPAVAKTGCDGWNQASPQRLFTTLGKHNQ